jgi:DNA-binding NtrC family response regulator
MQIILFEEMIGSSPPMQEIFATAQKVASTDIPILIIGESGTGKKMLAKAIHARSSRKDGPFISINCATTPNPLIDSELFGHEKGSFTGATAQRKGKPEYANGGTLFLNQIEELVPELQIKMLHLLQEKVIGRLGGDEMIPLDVRVIAATDRDLETEVREGRFRQEFYFGLGVVKITIPPLRERGTDVIHLAQQIVKEFSKELKRPPRSFSKSALKAMFERTNTPPYLLRLKRGTGTKAARSAGVFERL